MIWWGFGLVAGYLLLAPLLVVAVLWVMLRAGIVDWSGEKRPAPSDPLVIGYRGDPSHAFGWNFETVRYPTELGDAEAWVVPAAGDQHLWAIWVHGIGGTRENGYRLAKTLHEAGVPVLMITYRNDKAAPSSTDGFYSFGLSEWPDLEAAVTYAVSRGAERVVIVAESIGAAIAGQYLKRAGNTGRVAGLALDAPALDFPAVIHAAGRRYWVPLSRFVAATGLSIWGRVWRDLRKAESLDVVTGFAEPIFLAHGRRDPLVPFSISEQLVQKRPDILLVANDADRHPMSYAADREGYSAKLVEWLHRVRNAIAAGTQ
jgi:acetyl esterase/lipase